VAPVITGQHEITTAKNVPLIIDLNMLMVDDSDNTYPDDFYLSVTAGNNFSLNSNQVTPAHNFTGTLEVGVQVNDGIANSNVFKLNILVREGNIPPQIIGQSPLVTEEETPLSIGFDDLIVFDPDSPYPSGFTLRIADGARYAAGGRTVTPLENYSGALTVMVTVHDGQLASDPYPLTITVTPVNDAPVIKNMEREVLRYFANAGPASLTEHIQVSDPDGDNIAGAEISFDIATYHSGHDVLSYDAAQQEDLPIEAVFDSENGTLFLIGSAPASDYQAALRSVAYYFSHEDMESVQDVRKTLYIVVRDGEVESDVVSREIDFSGEITLDVPRVFTPNGDMANDTWSITPLQNADNYTDAVTRVYNIRGQLLYEASGFEWQWDGRYQGQYLPSDTYYYVISINSGVNLSNRKGIVSILK
jgi:gliding motility-associated-like protein